MVFLELNTGVRGRMMGMTEERRRTLRRTKMMTLPKRTGKAAKISHTSGKIFTSKLKVRECEAFAFWSDIALKINWRMSLMLLLRNLKILWRENLLRENGRRSPVISFVPHFFFFCIGATNLWNALCGFIKTRTTPTRFWSTTSNCLLSQKLSQKMSCLRWVLCFRFPLLRTFY